MPKIEQIINNPQEEQKVFQEKVEKRAQEIFAEQFSELPEKKQEILVSENLDDYQKSTEKNISSEFAKKTSEAEAIVLKLSPDEDDSKMEELLGLIEKVGIINTLKAIESTESFHIKDDLHRVLVQYIKSGYDIALKEKAPIYPGLHMTLFEVKLPEDPENKEDQKEKTLELLLASMEQFYAGMFSVSEDSSDKNYFSIEIAYPQGREEVVFFVAVPDLKANIFKNQLLAIFPHAVLKEITNDYNIFNKREYIAISQANLSQEISLPITTYKDLTYDPLNIILQSFSNLDKEEGAAIQIMLSPAKDNLNKKMVQAMDKIAKGENISKALNFNSNLLLKIVKEIGETIFNLEKNTEIKDQEKRNLILEEIKKKNTSRFYKTNIRLISAGNNNVQARKVIQELKAAFNQFASANGNSFKFKDFVNKKEQEKMINKYTFRIFDFNEYFYFNISELTTIFHFPSQKLGAGSILASSLSSSAGVSKKIEKIGREEKEKKLSEYDYQIPKKQGWEKGFVSPTPTPTPISTSTSTSSMPISSALPLEPLTASNNLVDEVIINNTSDSSLSSASLGDNSFSENRGVLLGINHHQGTETPVYLKPIDRMRHMYVVGQTGTGKTTILKNMIVQDIKNGEGCCFIDPHGSDVEDILANIPVERMDDVIYFDTTNMNNPMGLNMLEYDLNYPEQKSFVIDELLGIFKKLYSDVPESMGPAFEQYFRNATALVIEDPESGNTMVEISRVLSDEDFRNMKLARSKNMIINQFWEKIATQAGGDASLENIVPYITNKFDVFLSNDYIRPIIAQEKSAFNFRDAMDNKKILLVNLAKGKIGDLNANLIGMIIVGKFLAAALSRVDSLHKNLAPFYLYMDEFQNITTNSISQILSEARKYKLSLNIAHQYIKQIDEKIKDAVFGNVGSLAVFRVGQEDAEVLEPNFKPTFSATDIANIPNRNAYLRLLVDGEPQKPFNISTLKPDEGNSQIAEQIKKLSTQKYGGDREKIEAQIQEKFKSLM